MPGNVRQEHLGGQWTEAGLLLNSCWTAKLLGQQLLHALPAKSQCRTRAELARVAACAAHPQSGIQPLPWTCQRVSALICFRSVRSRPALRTTQQRWYSCQDPGPAATFADCAGLKGRQVGARGELQKRLWPEHTFVDFEDGVNTAAQKLRDALGDDPEKPHYLETVPRRGYPTAGLISCAT